MPSVVPALKTDLSQRANRSFHSLQALCKPRPSITLTPSPSTLSSTIGTKKQFHHRVNVGEGQWQVEGTVFEILIFDDDTWQSSDGSVLQALPTTMAISCAAIKAQHHTLI